MYEISAAIIEGSPQRALKSAVAATRSPFSYAAQVQDYGGECWTFEVTLAAKGRRLEAFANAILNKRQVFTFRDPSLRNVGCIGLYVAGAGGSANQLLIAGPSAGQLEAGDFFSLERDGRHALYQLTDDVRITEAGVVVSFVPRLRWVPTVGAQIDAAEPAISLIGDEHVMVETLVLARGQRHIGSRLSMTASEAI